MAASNENTPQVLSAVLNYARPAVLDDYDRREYSDGMSETQKKRQLTDLELSECSALNAIYKAKKKDLGVTQEMIAIDGLGAKTQSAASHYLTGKNALNIEAAIVFAKYLQVPVDSFSPRLAAEIAGMAEMAVGSSRSYQSDLYAAAPADQRAAVDEIADKMLRLTPEQAMKLKQAMDLLMPTDDTRKD